MSNAEPNTKIKISVDTHLKEPSLFKLIYVNDNETAMEFVIKTLPYEMAEQKGVEVTVMARGAGWPLQVKLEPDN